MKRIYLIIMVVALVLTTLFGQTLPVSAAFTSSPQQAQTAAQAVSDEVLGTEQLVSDSDAVVVGTVSNTTSRWNAGHTLIFTDALVSIDNVLKGDKTLRQAKITQVGGKVGDITLQVSGSASFLKNERAVLFLKNDLSVYVSALKTNTKSGLKEGCISLDRLNSCS